MVMPTPLPPLPRLLRGSVVMRRRRCGKRNCRCADGQQLHEALALSYSDRGRTKIVLLDDGDVEAVTAAVARPGSPCCRAHLPRRRGRASRRRHAGAQERAEGGRRRELPRRGALDEEPGRLRLGLNVVVVCLRVDPPWGGTPIALPLNLRIRAKKNGKKTTELAP